MSQYLSVINQAKRQQILVHKLIKLFFVRCYRVPYKGRLHEEIAHTIETFNSVNSILAAYVETSEEAYASVTEVNAAWTKLLRSIHSMNVDYVLDLSSKLVAELDRLIGLLDDEQDLCNKQALIAM